MRKRIMTVEERDIYRESLLEYEVKLAEKYLLIRRMIEEEFDNPPPAQLISHRYHIQERLRHIDENKENCLKSLEHVNMLLEVIENCENSDKTRIISEHWELDQNQK